MSHVLVTGNKCRVCVVVGIIGRCLVGERGQAVALGRMVKQ